MCSLSSNTESPNSHYYDPKTTNVSILPLVQPFINRIVEEAKQQQMTSGQFILHIITHVLNQMDQEFVNVHQLMPSNIITINFFCSLHVDGDSMSKVTSNLVKKSIEESS